MFFEKLNNLALQCPLVIAVTTDPASGKMTLVITPKADKDAPEAALRQPLTLTATPAEFDAEFFDVLEKYSNARQSLQEQVDATTEVLNAAKSAQVGKAAKATAKPGKATVVKPATASTDEDPGDDGDANGGTNATNEGSAASAPEGAKQERVSLFG